MTSRIIILGIDGLEYNLVEEWDLKYLKQKVYTKTDLSDFGVIITPLIWAAMLTGKKIEGIEKIFLKRAKFFSEKPQSVKKKDEQYLTAKIASRILPKSAKDWIIKNILPDPFERTYDYLIRNKERTIFDFFENPWTNGIPSYGKNVADKRIKKIMGIAASGHPDLLYKESIKLFKKDKVALFNALTKNYDLLFWYTPFLDEIEHFYITRKTKLLNIYLELNKMVEKIYDESKNNEIIYIISDHGMVPVKNNATGYLGDHSDHGFFSSNTGELIQKPQDLFNLIVSKSIKK